MFCETLSTDVTEDSVCSKVSFPNFVLLRILSLWIFVDLHKTRGYPMAISEFLFAPALLPPAIRNPGVSKALGFRPLAPIPSVERFSSFLRDMYNQELKTLHQQLVKSLIEAKVITGKSIAIDSCPIVVPLKENNLKTSMKDRFDKIRFVKSFVPNF